MAIVGHLINGQIVTDGDRNQDIYNPSTERLASRLH